MAKVINPNLCKINRSYTVEEIATLFDVHKNSVRAWIKKGLPVCDDLKPLLILGGDLKAFLKAKRAQNKRTCKTNELYCCKCRAPQLPELSTIEFRHETTTKGRVIAQCSTCHSRMNKYFKLANLEQIRDQLTDRHKTTKLEGDPLPEQLL
jgi:hypothetical protein